MYRDDYEVSKTRPWEECSSQPDCVCLAVCAMLPQNSIIFRPNPKERIYRASRKPAGHFRKSLLVSILSPMNFKGSRCRYRCLGGSSKCFCHTYTAKNKTTSAGNPEVSTTRTNKSNCFRLTVNNVLGPCHHSWRDRLNQWALAAHRRNARRLIILIFAWFQDSLAALVERLPLFSFPCGENADRVVHPSLTNDGLVLPPSVKLDLHGVSTYWQWIFLRRGADACCETMESTETRKMKHAKRLKSSLESGLLEPGNVYMK